MKISYLIKIVDRYCGFIIRCLPQTLMFEHAVASRSHWLGKLWQPLEVDLAEEVHYWGRPLRFLWPDFIAFSLYADIMWSAVFWSFPMLAFALPCLLHHSGLYLSVSVAEMNHFSSKLFCVMYFFYRSNKSTNKVNL